MTFLGLSPQKLRDKKGFKQVLNFTGLLRNISTSTAVSAVMGIYCLASLFRLVNRAEIPFYFLEAGMTTRFPSPWRKAILKCFRRLERHFLPLGIPPTVRILRNRKGKGGAGADTEGKQNKGKKVAGSIKTARKSSIFERMFANGFQLLKV